MKASLLARLQRLEALRVWNRLCLFRYGWLERLPKEFVGERHIAMVQSEATSSPNVEWCQFEERPGPPPPEADGGSFIVCLTR